MLNNPIPRYNICLLVSFFWQAKETKETTTLIAHFFHNMILYQVTSLSIGVTFL